MSKKTECIYHADKTYERVDGKFTWVPHQYVVAVMATSGAWALVRRKGAIPFAAQVKRLENINP